jgi:hypothetical protein
MPYIPVSERDAIKVNVNNVTTVGQLNYFFTLALLRYWKAAPSYATIHAFRRDFVVDPKNNELISKIRRDFCDRFTVADVHTAAAEAFYEFRSRVGRKYEKSKRLANRDLEEYKDALDALEPTVEPEVKA